MKPEKLVGVVPRIKGRPEHMPTRSEPDKSKQLPRKAKHKLPVETVDK